MFGRRTDGDGGVFEIVGLTLVVLTAEADNPGEDVNVIASGFNPGVFGRLADFVGPEGTSSARRLARSTVSRNVIAASRFVRQYAASPSILLSFRYRCMKYRLLMTSIPSGRDVISV